MRRPGFLIPGLLLLGACAESPTAPDLAAPSQPSVAAAREQGLEVTCVATSTTSGYSVSVSWARAKVKNVSLVTEDGTLTTSLVRPRRRGTVTFTPASEPLGYRLDDGTQTLAQGGCAAP